MREYPTLGGRLTIRLRDPVTGRVVRERRVHNLVTLAGRGLLAELLTGNVQSFARMELVVGGPATPEDPAATTPEATLEDQALNNQLAAVLVTMGGITEMPDEDGKSRMVIPVSGTLEADLGSQKLVMTEAGLAITKHDDSVVLYNRVVFDTITKEPNLQMTLTWEVMF